MSKFQTPERIVQSTSGINEEKDEVVDVVNYNEDSENELGISENIIS